MNLGGIGGKWGRERRYYRAGHQGHGFVWLMKRAFSAEKEYNLDGEGI